MKNPRIFLYIRTIGMIVMLLIIFGCKDVSTEVKKSKSDLSKAEEKLYRPNFHFTPANNWMNDPNGMFYYNGKYHLYYQYYPEDNVWGPMHWGHAISEDLVSWKEQPIAMYPDGLGYIFSGSAVVDHNNTSGFAKDGKIPIVAMFTYHDINGEKAGKIDFQSQAIAYSLDEGQTWTKYGGNPVIPNPGIKDFRDPKVTWDVANSQWVMVLATYEKTLFYTSMNLKQWDLSSDFGEGIGAHGGVWECPDFFKIKVEGTDETKWVLLQSINPGHINGGSGTQYFVGDFNGKEFILDEEFAEAIEKEAAIWLDFGRDNYAGVTWSNIPEADGRKLFMGWMSNWDYAQIVPTETWRSAMTLARELQLKKVNNGYRLVSNPIAELEAYKKTIIDKVDVKFTGKYELINRTNIDVNKSVCELKLTNLGQDDYKFSLSNEHGDLIEFGINNIERYYYIDRRQSGKTEFSEKFAHKISKASFATALKEINLQIIIDKTSIEIFYNNGETVMTEIFFPNAPLQSIRLNSNHASSSIISKLRISQLDI